MQEIEGISGWQMVWKLMPDLPDEIFESAKNCESPIEQLLTCALSIVIFSLEQQCRPRIATQVPIGKYRADIVLVGGPSSRGTVIECDGAAFHRDKEKDRKRTRDIEAEGYTVLRASGSEIYHNPISVARSLLYRAGFIVN